VADSGTTAGESDSDGAGLPAGVPLTPGDGTPDSADGPDDAATDVTGCGVPLAAVRGLGVSLAPARGGAAGAGVCAGAPPVNS
jgi:hypothetical protein